MPNHITHEYHLKNFFDLETTETIANLAIEYKFISFYLIQKQPFDNLILSKYYKVLIKGTTLIKTTDLRSASYSFDHLDDILFCYIRLLINTSYEEFFNQILYDSDRVIEITGLIHGGWIPQLESRITHLTIQLLLLENLKKQPTTYQWEGALNAISLAKIDTLIDLLKKLHKEIQRFDDYHSLNWDEKKLSLSKIKLINYIEKVLEITKKSITTKFNFIKLD